MVIITTCVIQEHNNLKPQIHQQVFQISSWLVGVPENSSLAFSALNEKYFLFLCGSFFLADADDLAKELGSAINVGSLELEDFPSEALRESLSRLDAEALDMLTNPDMGMVTDPATEAHFRLENDM